VPEPVTYDLVIAGKGRSGPIGRHTWLRVALHTPRLKQTSIYPELPEHQGIELPAFGLLSNFGRPILFWRDGEVIVKRAQDEYLPDLAAIARALDARLVRPDGTDAYPGED
jgi:hypothetical protein